MAAGSPRETMEPDLIERCRNRPLLVPNSPILEEDGIPMESPWHKAQLRLSLEVLRRRFGSRPDF